MSEPCPHCGSTTETDRERFIRVVSALKERHREALDGISAGLLALPLEQRTVALSVLLGEAHISIKA